MSFYHHFTESLCSTIMYFYNVFFHFPNLKLISDSRKQEVRTPSQVVTSCLLLNEDPQLSGLSHLSSAPLISPSSHLNLHQLNLSALDLFHRCRWFAGINHISSVPTDGVSVAHVINIYIVLHRDPSTPSLVGLIEGENLNFTQGHWRVGFCSVFCKSGSFVFLVPSCPSPRLVRFFSSHFTVHACLPVQSWC